MCRSRWRAPRDERSREKGKGRGRGPQESTRRSRATKPVSALQPCPLQELHRIFRKSPNSHAIPVRQEAGKKNESRVLSPCPGSSSNTNPQVCVAKVCQVQRAFARSQFAIIADTGVDPGTGTYDFGMCWRLRKLCRRAKRDFTDRAFGLPLVPFLRSDFVRAGRGPCPGSTQQRHSGKGVPPLHLL